MKKHILITTCLSLGISFAAHAAKLDQIVAYVNDDVVTQSEVDHGLALYKMQLAQSHISAPSKDTMVKQVTNQLIDKKLQLQLAKQVGITIKDADIDKVVKNIAEQNRISVDTLYKRINQEGMTTADYRDELKSQLTIQRLQQQEIGSRITVTPEEIKLAMKKSGRSQSAAQSVYHLEDILIPLDDNASTKDIDAARAKAASLATALSEKGALQAKLEAKSKAFQYNDLGWLSLGDMPSAFVDSVKSASDDSIAGPIQTGNGFHLIHVAGIRSQGNDASTINQKQVEASLLQQKFAEQAEQWVAKMRSQAYVAIQ